MVYLRTSSVAFTIACTGHHSKQSVEMLCLVRLVQSTCIRIERVQGPMETFSSY